MTYTIKHADWHWLIEPIRGQKRFNLKFKRPSEWSLCNSYDTPDEAADAVVKGRTGLSDWDALQHAAPVPNLGSWLIDPNDPLGSGISMNPVTS